MAVERLSLVPVVLDNEEGKGPPNPPRLPRWSRQELLVLIQGKRVAEGIRNSSRKVQMVVEPKWSSVSSYCKRHGVDRGPVQCRKRWSNLAGDFKKIKEWEQQQQAQESFWVMRNDLRRERKLPGFFDREVYDILLVDADVDADADNSLVLLSLAPSSSSQPQAEDAANNNDKEVVFDSGRTAAADNDNGLFSHHKEDEDEDGSPRTAAAAAAPTPISAATHSYYHNPFSLPPPTADKQTTSPTPQGRKRKRPTDTDNEEEKEDMSLQKQLIEAMERNGRLLTSQLEIHNTNSHLDREQRKDHANALFSVLNKLADAMVRIADKL